MVRHLDDRVELNPPAGFEGAPEEEADRVSPLRIGSQAKLRTRTADSEGPPGSARVSGLEGSISLGGEHRFEGGRVEDAVGPEKELVSVGGANALDSLARELAEPASEQAENELEAQGLDELAGQLGPLPK